MGCGSSTPAANGVNNGGANHRNPYDSPSPKRPDDPQEALKSGGIDRDLDRARQQDAVKVKLLLLGAGESGKSTIFKQMRILYGTPRSDDDLRMYGVVVRSNIITAMKKLCLHLKELGLEENLQKEPKLDDNDYSPSEAMKVLYAHLVDHTGDPSDLHPLPEPSKDWVGHSPRAKPLANSDAKLFLQIWKYIKALWDVSTVQQYTTPHYSILTSHSLLSFSQISVGNNERSMVQKSCCQRD